MSDKKHIDRVFQEKLKDLEATPNPEVWENIQNRLEQPKEDKEKIFPIWWRYAGIAALLLVLLTVGNLIQSDKDSTTNTKVVDTENTVNASETDANSKNEIRENADITTNSIAEESSNPSKNNESLLEAKNNSEENKKNIHTEITSSNTSKYTPNNTGKNTNNAVANTRLKNNNATAVTENKNKEETNKKNTIVAAKNKRSLPSNFETTKKNSSQDTNPNHPIVSTKVKEENNTITNAISNPIAQNKVNPIAENANKLDKNKVATELKNSSTNAVTEVNTNGEEDNTITDVSPEKEDTSIEEAIANAEDLIEKEEEEKVNRWQVYANIAPVYYNTLGKGSHIDEEFSENSKTGEINTSYGVNVSYAFNEKLKLRSGINSLNLSYDTDNVILYQNVSGGGAPTMKNIDFNSEQGVSAISASNLGVQQALGILPNENAAISQRLGYYEVPMELEYTLSNNKFGVNVIAGLSTLILNDNKIYSEYEGRNTEIGEANNINDLSFSGNLGLGLDYKFSDKVKFNVQPTFKYQLNAYENTSGNFRPYIIGVYTGLSYQF